MSGPPPSTPDEHAALEALVWELSAPHTLEAIAQRLGRTPQGILAIERRALAKLRAGCDAVGVTPGDAEREPPRLHRACPREDGDTVYANAGQRGKRLF